MKGKIILSTLSTPFPPPLLLRYHNGVLSVYLWSRNIFPYCETCWNSQEIAGSRPWAWWSSDEDFHPEAQRKYHGTSNTISVSEALCRIVLYGWNSWLTWRTLRHFEAAEAKLLRVVVSSFCDYLNVSLKCLQEFEWCETWVIESKGWMIVGDEKVGCNSSSVARACVDACLQNATWNCGWTALHVCQISPLENGLHDLFWVNCLSLSVDYWIWESSTRICISSAERNWPCWNRSAEVTPLILVRRQDVA